MELLHGRSLADRMEQGPLEPAEAMELATGIAQGLRYAHENGVIHRDLKPANVMLTRGGHPKLIDFGLAKMLDAEQSPFLGEARPIDPAQRSATGEQVIVGTVGYMSPEQARGGKVDARSDVFSFGILLYHMLTGRLPFEGVSQIDTLYSILGDPTPRLGGLGAEERQLLQPIIDRCLEKDPDRRYPDAGALLEDVKRRRLRLEAGRGTSGWKRALAAVAAGVAGTAVAVTLLSREPAPAPVDGKPSIAVLHFDNLSGDPELEWLRTGLTDMLVTDLSQSPELSVLGTDRLYEILDDVGGLNRDSLRPDAIQEIAERASVGSVVRGSFAQAGDSIRISARLEDADSGRVLLSAKAEGTGQESLFRLVDEISGRIKSNFSVPALEGELDRDLRDVTTASVEAYRSYAEGIRLHERFREEEAVPHFQRAVELDPGFAMALAKLGVVLNNLGRQQEADEYAEAALEHVDRLSERERHYIEGWYYSRDPETIPRALEAYRRAVELYPDHGSARHNLGNLLLGLEDYDAAIEQLEELRRRGMSFPATHENLASAYWASGDESRAMDVLEDFVERNPDDWTTLLLLAKLHMESGDVERGLDGLSRAEALGADAMRTAPLRWEAQVLDERWAEAGQTARELRESDSEMARAYGGQLETFTALYQGNYREALVQIGQYTGAMGKEEGPHPKLFMARLQLEVGQVENARDTAAAVAAGADGPRAHLEALAISAVAEARLGRHDEAAALARRLEGRAGAEASRRPERLHQLVLGELAIARGDYEEAFAALNEAESLLPPRGGDGIHAVIWYALATAHRLAGNDGEAALWYERILDSTSERLFEPISFVRSFYFLGEIHDQNGEPEEAAEAFERFVAHWGDGELDRDRVSRARARLD